MEWRSAGGWGCGQPLHDWVALAHHQIDNLLREPYLGPSFSGAPGAKALRTALEKNMSRNTPAPQMARDLKRSALAVALVLLKELDGAVPEEHGAQAIAALLLGQKSASDRVHAAIDATDENVDAVLLSITATIGRLLDAVDDKCPEGPLKPMLLFKLVEELAQEGYELDCIVDFVRQAHAGGSRPDEPAQPRTPSEIMALPASVGVVIPEGLANMRGAALRPSQAA